VLALANRETLTGAGTIAAPGPYSSRALDAAANSFGAGGEGPRGLVRTARAGVVLDRGGATRDVAGRVELPLVLLLVLAVLLPGILVAFDLPGKLEVASDVGAVLLVAYLAVAVWRGGRPLVVPWLVIVVVFVLLIAAMTADDLPRMVVAAKNYLLLPVLGMLLAWLGPRESIARAVVLTAIGLVLVQFVTTIGQALTIEDVDLRVGTFGDYSGPSTTFAAVAGACLAFGAFAAKVPYRWLFLVIAVAVPTMSVWAALRIVVIELPLAAGAVAVAAWWAARPDGPLSADRWRTALLPLVGAVVLASGLVVGGYAFARPFDFQLFTEVSAQQTYLEDSTIVEIGGAGEGGKKGERRERQDRIRQAKVAPGRGEQLRSALRLIDGGALPFLFGTGLGTTTYAENLGIDIPEDRDVRLAGFLDFGTVLVETGVIGIALILAGALLIGLGALGAARAAPRGSWTLALLLAYPGVLVAMLAGLVHGAPLRNIGSAMIFWVLTGAVLATLLSPAAQPRARRN
jgi:hypothetical protein